MSFSAKKITHKLLMKRLPLAVFQKIITYKLLVKRPPLAVFQKIIQKKIAITLTENKIFVKGNHE